MNPASEYLQGITRRHFLRDSQAGLGAMALAGLMGTSQSQAASTPNVAKPMFAPKAKHVIYLHMAGSPPQHDLFDFKPKLVEHTMQPCPDELLEILKKERLPFIDLNARRPKLLGTPYKFAQHGDSGQWMSELLPNLSEHADDLCVIRSMKTDQFNHAPAQLLLYTGSPRFGGASLGSWATYGLGSESENLPAFVVMVTGGTDPSGGKSLWGSGFLPSVYQGVQCRTKGDPILYVSDPVGMSRGVRRKSLDALQRLNELEHQRSGDPETQTRISQYELAYRMQMAVPEAMDVSQEPKHIQEAYGIGGDESFANTCLLARRLVERGVRFVQLFNWGWDTHGTGKGDDIVTQLPKKCEQVDKPIAALLGDLKQRGLLDETLVIWSGEFGRTAMNEERGGSKFLGRDHHPHCFTIWMAGGGVQPGLSYGATDDLGYFVTENEMPVPDLQATILHLLGLDPHRFSVPFQGLNQRLIGPSNDPKIHHDLIA